VELEGYRRSAGGITRRRTGAGSPSVATTEAGSIPTSKTVIASGSEAAITSSRPWPLRFRLLEHHLRLASLEAGDAGAVLGDARIQGPGLDLHDAYLARSGSSTATLLEAAGGRSSSFQANLPPAGRLPRTVHLTLASTPAGCSEAPRERCAQGHFRGLRRLLRQGRELASPIAAKVRSKRLGGRPQVEMTWCWSQCDLLVPSSDRRGTPAPSASSSTFNGFVLRCKQVGKRIL